MELSIKILLFAKNCKLVIFSSTTYVTHEENFSNDEQFILHEVYSFKTNFTSVFLKIIYLSLIWL